MEIVEKRAGRASADEVLSVWREYRRTGSLERRDELVFMFIPMVRYIVYRKVRKIPPQCDPDELISSGLEALMRSIERYDPCKGATLEQYAWTRIHGAVLDELRRCDWVPRSLRRYERAIENARASFFAAHERQPNRDELASWMEVDPFELVRCLDDLELAEVGSLNRIVCAEETTYVEHIDLLESSDEDCDPIITVERGEARERVRKALAKLNRRDRELAIMLYVEDRPPREVGERLGVSESRISQLHTRMRERLHDQLAGEPSLFSAAS